jgi:hypothetical protein
VIAGSLLPQAVAARRLGASGVLGLLLVAKARYGVLAYAVSGFERGIDLDAELPSAAH